MPVSAHTDPTTHPVTPVTSRRWSRCVRACVCIRCQVIVKARHLLQSPDGDGSFQVRTAVVRAVAAVLAQCCRHPQMARTANQPSGRRVVANGDRGHERVGRPRQYLPPTWAGRTLPQSHRSHQPHHRDESRPPRQQHPRTTLDWGCPQAPHKAPCRPHLPNAWLSRSNGVQKIERRWRRIRLVKLFRATA